MRGGALEGAVAIVARGVGRRCVAGCEGRCEIKVEEGRTVRMVKLRGDANAGRDILVASVVESRWILVWLCMTGWLAGWYVAARPGVGSRRGLEGVVTMKVVASRVVKGCALRGNDCGMCGAWTSAPVAFGDLCFGQVENMAHVI